MQLYPRAQRIYADLQSLGYPDGAPVPVDVLSQYDQLHYHGTDALDVAIDAIGMVEGDQVLEVGSGWGGCARYLAHRTGAQITAVELQADYHAVGQDLTARAALADRVTHVNADFLEHEIAPDSYDYAVSWLALFHIPKRADYLAKLADAVKSGGILFVEDLYQITPPPGEEQADFNRHLFPNSLVDLHTYRDTLESAGFDLVKMTDMTTDWTAFTAARLDAFRDNRMAYEQVHGATAYEGIEVFYDKMAGYLARGLVGGLRYAARRR
nr:class I SAM-dependent methyltransferase [Sulfitobacter aestuariivivens]